MLRAVVLASRRGSACAAGSPHTLFLKVRRKQSVRSHSHFNAHKAFWLASWIQDGWSTSRSEWQVFLVCPLILQDFLPLLRHPPGGQAMQKGCQTLSQSVLTGNVYSPLVLLLCSCTALEQLQLQVSINFLLIQPISNKKNNSSTPGSDQLSIWPNFL